MQNKYLLRKVPQKRGCHSWLGNPGWGGLSWRASWGSQEWLWPLSWLVKAELWWVCRKLHSKVTPTAGCCYLPFADFRSRVNFSGHSSEATWTVLTGLCYLGRPIP